VNAATAAAFAVAAVFALGDWAARTRRESDRRARVVEYVCKPATLGALLVAAVVLDPAAAASDRRAWFVAALACSLVGDVLLMLPRDLFVGGLAAFLLGHVAYLGGFWTRGPAGAALAIAVAVVVVAVVPLGRRILGALAARAEPVELRAAVTVYMVVISAMLATALATGNVLAGAGAALFVASDSMIAWDRFVGRFAWAPVAIMVTYHLGQAGLVASLLR
jgi:uncharacterized membrane protein YhhN